MSNSLLGAVYTLILCLVSALSRILLKKGMRDSTPLTGMVVSLVVGFAALGLVVAPKIVSGGVRWDPRGVLMFAAIGLVAPPLVRLLTYIGIHRLGASRCDPIRSTQPFFAILFALLLVGERAGPRIWAATALLFLGVLILSRDRGRQASFSPSDLLFPLGAAILAGAVMVLRKMGIAWLPDPAVAAFIAATSAVVVFGGFLAATGKWRALRLDRRAFAFFFLAGLLTALTDILDLLALSLTDVRIVAPLMCATPLFVLVLARLFLRDQERVTLRTWSGAGAILAGVQIILWTAKAK